MIPATFLLSRIIQVLILYHSEFMAPLSLREAQVARPISDKIDFKTKDWERNTEDGGIGGRWAHHVLLIT